MPIWNIHDTPERAAEAAAEAMATLIRQRLEQQDTCHVALPGGTTPARCLARLADMDLPWTRVHWYLGDERCLPPGDPQRNDVMIERELWARIAAPAETRHPVPAERGAEAAAHAYATEIAAAAPLDLVFLGMGEDGHTASLFPGNPALDDPRPVVPVFAAPKPPPERVSLGLTTLRAARHRMVLATGAGKRAAARKIRAGADLPLNRIGELVWFGDAAALAEG